jgi:hypothetical protein
MTPPNADGGASNASVFTVAATYARPSMITLLTWV